MFALDLQNSKPTPRKEISWDFILLLLEFPKWPTLFFPICFINWKLYFVFFKVANGRDKVTGHGKFPCWGKAMKLSCFELLPNFNRCQTELAEILS